MLSPRRGRASGGNVCCPAAGSSAVVSSRGARASLRRKSGFSAALPATTSACGAGASGSSVCVWPVATGISTSITRQLQHTTRKQDCRQPAGGFRSCCRLRASRGVPESIPAGCSSPFAARGPRGCRVRRRSLRPGRALTLPVPPPRVERVRHKLQKQIVARRSGNRCRPGFHYNTRVRARSGIVGWRQGRCRKEDHGDWKRLPSPGMYCRAFAAGYPSLAPAGRLTGAAGLAILRSSRTKQL